VLLGLPVLLLWLALFSFAFLGYESDRVKNQIARLETIAQSRDSQRILAFVPLIQSRKITVKIIFYDPASIIHALDTEYDTVSSDGSAFQ
jgi:hypothetical protein